MDKKKPELRVLHLSSARSWRGGEQQVAYLAEELQKMGVTQWIFCTEGSAMEAFCKKSGLSYFRYRKGFSLNPVPAWEIKRLCKMLDASHLHTHDSHAHTFAFLSAIFGNKPPVIVHRRVDFPVGRGFFSRWKYNHPAVRKIVCVSNFIKEIMAPAIRDNSRLTVIHSGIDPGRFQPVSKKTSALRKEYNIPSADFIIANIAAIAPHKDYYTFVKTAEILIKQGLSARFLLIGGDGGEEQGIRHFIKEKGLEGHLVLTGFRNDIPQILPEIDVLLFTSRTEGLGTSLLDAFACNVPVVATAAGGVTEVVEHEVTGLLAPVGDAEELARLVKMMLTEAGLRAKLVSNARQKANGFSKEAMAKRMVGIYRSI